MLQKRKSNKYAYIVDTYANTIIIWKKTTITPKSAIKQHYNIILDNTQIQMIKKVNIFHFQYRSTVLLFLYNIQIIL